MNIDPEREWKDTKIKRKDKVYIKLKELTQSISFDESKKNIKKGFEADYIARQVNITRNNASKELNELLRDGLVIKILGKPTLYLDRAALSKKYNIKIHEQVIKDYQAFMDLIFHKQNKKNNSAVHDLSDRNRLRQEPSNPGREASGELMAGCTYSKGILDNIIGAEGSLKLQVQQAKAAVFYPPNGLHTLIVGATGVGKSTFAEAMYRYAVEAGKLNKNAAFIIFNCADYAENTQLLLSQLFGYVKGAFTGAEKEKKGLVDQADGGILFLDEVHRLPPEGQEMMFLLMDKGIYRRLGESENTRKAQMLIIAATTEDPHTSMLRTFLRRIPVIIRLPSLSEISLKERISIIYKFFTEESERIKVMIKASKEVLEGLMLYDCTGNIGQLRSDIQLICARAFLDCITYNKDVMDITLLHASEEVQEGFFKSRQKRDIPFKYFNLNGSDYVLFDGKNADYQDSLRDTLFMDDYKTGEDFYDLMVDDWQKFSDEGYSEDEIRERMIRQIEDYFQNLFPKIKPRDSAINKDAVLKIIEPEVFNSVREILNEMTDIFSIPDDKKIIYGLSLHVGVLVERLKLGMAITNPNKDKISMEHPEEYRMAQALKSRLEKKLNIEIPDDETAFLAMFLYAVKVGKNKRNIGVLVIAHGKSSASSMVEVANTLMGNEHAVAVDMPLDESIETALARAEEQVRRIDRGRGVLIMVDMGSLTSFSRIITEKTCIATKTVSMVSTLMVIEAVRKALLPDMTLDVLAEDMENMSPSPVRKHDAQVLENLSKSSRDDLQDILVDILGKTLIFLDTKKACGALYCVLQNICRFLNINVNNEFIIKFMFHCTCMIERAIRNEPLPFKNTASVLYSGLHMHGEIRKQFELIEETFGIAIPDTELAYIVEMFNMI